MANSKKFALKFAAKAAKSIKPSPDDWGGGNAPTFGAGNQLLIEGTITESPEIEDDMSSNGTINRGRGQVVHQPVSFELNSSLWTQGLKPILQACTGWHANKIVDFTAGAGRGRYGHLVGINPIGAESRDFSADDEAALTTNTLWPAGGACQRPYVHLGAAYGPSDTIARMGAVTDWTLSAASKGGCKVSVKGIAESATHVVTDTDWSVASGTQDEWYQLRDSLGAKIGPIGSLIDADILEMELAASIGRTDGSPDSSTGLNISEPVVNNIAEVTLKLKLNRHDTDDYLTWMKASTIIAVCVQFARNGRKFNVYIPAAQITSAVPSLDGTPSTDVEIRTVNYVIGTADHEEFTGIKDVGYGTFDRACPVWLEFRDSDNTHWMMNA